ELVDRGGEEPLERAGGPLAQHADVRQQEHDGEREDPEQDEGDPVELRLVLPHEVDEREQHERHDEHERRRAVVVLQLAQDPAGRAGEQTSGHHATSAVLMRVRNAASRSSVPPRPLTSAGVPSATTRPSRTRMSRSQRLASSMTWLETMTVTPSSASARKR